MNKNAIFWSVFILSLNANSQLPCKAPVWDEITIGKTTESEIIKKYGKGYRGPAGERSYIDQNKEVELIVGRGEGNIIEALTLSKLENIDSAKNIPISKNLSKNASFGKNGFTLTSDRKTVRKLLGEPGNIKNWGKKNEEDWTYSTSDCHQFVNISIEIDFVGDTIYKVVLYNGE
jgi:hypothetical protein